MAVSELHIIAPGICGPLVETTSLRQNPVVKDWIKTLSRAARQTSASSLGDLLCSLFGLSCEGDFPSAALSMLAQSDYDVSQFYMFADPVHMQADMDHALLTSSADLSISDEQAGQLCATLNSHFQQDGLRFIKIDKDHWLLACADNNAGASERVINRIKTTSLADAVGRNVNFILPEGESAGYWKQVMTEAQMLLHSHEINATREAAGLLSINSLWFHGAGDLPVYDGCQIDSVCSSDRLFEGLATHVQCEYQLLPESVDRYIMTLSAEDARKSNVRNHVLHLPALEHLINYSDVGIWSDALAPLLKNRVYPLLKMVANKDIAITLYPCNGKQYRFSRYDNLRFWRSPVLSQHISSFCSYDV